jgi:predicted DNA repair protein MutK
MPSGLIALLDDVAMIAKLASASLDDIAGATAKAGTKAAGVVIDDTAVTPRYVHGLSPDRELPIIWKIALGSLKNKLLFLLPAALLLSAFLPWAITPLLMIGGAYLAFEAMEKIVEVLSNDHHDEAELIEADTPAELEARQVKGAIRTDLILSAEIMAIALASLGDMAIGPQAAALALVAVAITVGVYGAVAIIVKLDDIGLHMAEKRSAETTRRVGRFLVRIVPNLLSSLSGIGTAAMLWVGGGILLHGMEDLGLEHLPNTVHHVAEAVAANLGNAGPIGHWIASAIGAAIVGGAIGIVLVVVVRQLTRHPERYMVDV